MRIVASDFMSLDGVVQAPGGPDEDRDGGFAHGGWSMPFFDPETMGPAFDEAMRSTEALLFGRRTWQTMAAAWPERAGDPFADHMNAVRKYVVSGTLSQEDLDWNNSVLLPPEGWLEAVEGLRERDGDDLHVLGSPSVVSALARRDLVDEYRLMIEPITLGGGKRLFPDDREARTLELVEATTSATGVIIATYRRVRG